MMRLPLPEPAQPAEELIPVTYLPPRLESARTVVLRVSAALQGQQVARVLGLCACAGEPAKVKSPPAAPGGGEVVPRPLNF